MLELWARLEIRVSTQVQFDFDVCESRHKGERMSRAANLRANPGKAIMRERVLNFVRGCEWYGCTQEEFYTPAGKHPNEVSGRFRELEKAGLIFKSGRVRDKRNVYVADAKWINEHYASTNA